MKVYGRGEGEGGAAAEKEEEEEYYNTSMGIIRVKGVLRKTVCGD